MQFGQDFNAPFEAMREQAQRAMAARDALANLVGEASSEDGTVTAFVGMSGLKDLVFDPKAMRKPSADLAREVVEVTGQARERFEELRAEKAAELGAPTPPTPEETAAIMERMQSIVQSGHGDVQSMFQRFRDEAAGGR